MVEQAKQWIILEDSERTRIWDRVYDEFHFSPSVDSKVTPFVFNIPVDVYDISHSPIWKDNEKINTIIRTGFINAMGKSPFLYVLDWQHTCFRYNPRIKESIKSPQFIADDRYSGGGYNVYFPSFYPNGDYYFFIGQDFSWGYLTHPWLEKAYVFGKYLMGYFANQSTELGFEKCDT